MADLPTVYTGAPRFLLPPSFSSEELTRAQQYVLIDTRIAEINSARIMLSTARNSLASAIQVAPEILGLIFQQHVDNMLAEGEDGDLHPTWYFFSHVCSRWRLIALGNPALWSHISFRYPFWLRENLNRARKIPLLVNIGHYTNVMDGSVFVALQHTLAEITGRIRCLKVESFLVDGIESFLLAVPPAPALILESLSLLVTFEGDIDSPFSIIPKTLFNGITPNLRRVHVRGCKIHVESSILENLVHLHLERSIVCHTSLYKTSLSELLTILTHSPLLESLHLDTLSPIHVDSALPPPVTLSRLEHIHLVDNASTITILLINIRIPSFTSVSIFCVDDVGGYFSDVARALGIATINHPPKQFLNLFIECSERLYITGRIEKPDNARATWSLVFVWREREKTQVEVLVSNIVHSLNISTLLRLGFHEISDITESTWVDLFGAAKQVEDVAVSGKPTRGLLRALSSVGSSVGSTSINGTLFPRLQNLAIAGIVVDVTIKDSLLEIVQERQRKGSTIQRLDITLCKDFQDSDWLKDLEACIPSVIYGYYQSRMPESEKELEDISQDASSDEDASVLISGENTSSAYGSEYSSIDEFDYQD